jgi:hypothetical protein
MTIIWKQNLKPKIIIKGDLYYQHGIFVHIPCNELTKLKKFKNIHTWSFDSTTSMYKILSTNSLQFSNN